MYVFSPREMIEDAVIIILHAKDDFRVVYFNRIFAQAHYPTNVNQFSVEGLK